jgi:hypothetical protein
LDRRAFKAHKEQLEVSVPKAFRVRLVLQVRLDPKVFKVCKEAKDPQDLLDPKESKDHKELQALLDRRVQLDR